ncbi:MAG: hypothetical protein V3V26_00250 [Candidatus Aenigmarchaeota archaeon]
MRLLPLILPILAVMLVSGCTVPGFTSAGGGSGVVIETLEPDFSSVFEGESVQLQMKIKNTGSVDATEVKAAIFGMEKWTLQDKTKGSTCTLAESWSLLAPDEARGTSGGSKSCIYAYKSPSGIAKGLSMSYSPTVRVTYKYNTNTIKSITLLSSTEARRIEQQGGALPSETVSTTSSPVSVNIVTKGPIKVFKDGLQFPLEITVNNAGGGVVSTTISSKDWNKVKLYVTLPAGLTSNATDCPVGKAKARTLTLFKGQSNTITCTVAVTTAPTVPKQVQITANAENYYYFTEKSTTVTLTGI